MKPDSSPFMPDFLRNIHPVNADAYARFMAVGVPAPRSEAYKYTNIVAAVSDLNLRAVVQDGAGPREYDSSPLGLLNAAFAGAPTIIDIPPHASETTIRRLEWASCDGSFINPHVVIRVGAGATAIIHENLSGAGANWCNMVHDIHVAEGATLHHYRHVDGGNVVTQITNIRVAASGTCHNVLLNIGGDLVRHDLRVDLTGPRAQADIKCANLLRGAQHADLTARINHLARETRSAQIVRSVVMDRAHGVYQGKIYVDPAAQKTDSYQLSNALLLSPVAEMDTKPELEIYADDVKCAHGATTGALDDAQMFYLQSRGLPENEARALLLQAFMTSLFDDMDDGVKGEFKNRIDGWLL